MAADSQPLVLRWVFLSAFALRLERDTGGNTCAQRLLNISRFCLLHLSSAFLFQGWRAKLGWRQSRIPKLKSTPTSCTRSCRRCCLPTPGPSFSGSYPRLTPQVRVIWLLSGGGNLDPERSLEAFPPASWRENILTFEYGRRRSNGIGKNA